jgi:undecaprenyl-phosphate galactose phosphotransferase
MAWCNQNVPFKRAFDVLFSLSILVLLAPLFAGIAIAIRLSSKGKIFYVQTRLGRSGKVFKCYKFRTMYPDAQRRLPKLLARHPHLKQEWSINQKLHDDPRIFPLGRWLRRSSLDELPQFWNVMKGDLSVVGPRPYMVNQRQQMGFLASTILSIRPGITGLWQTSGRNKTTFEERIALDAAYVKRRSLWLDIKLILKTIPKLFCFTDAY